ncbi:hypothetical protein [Streptomyces endophyticus]|uniref:BZIP transcription factor n=1 Tax=Streptomyces endophyticus TaxID=714166 RepID=A0ABU6F648_9ACTN|nr:hypothetical protein [Streptomyces endophyticus]MEB8339438.1 bZIP transcription factor [Streptomyces endophyticus]
MNVRATMRRCVTGSAALVFAAAALFAGAPTASAHRDGCHRWHSCPSDTGSYVCGDLGYFSECGYSSLPGSGSDSGAGADDGQETGDYEPPEAPSASSPKAGAGGKVTVTAKAERGSRIEVREVDDPDFPEDGKRVAKATATGASQTVGFTADDGEHTYVLMAVDAADNSSDPSKEFTVDVDAEGPPLDDLEVGDPDGATGAVELSFITDLGTDYDIRVAGTSTRWRGTSEDGDFKESLWLPNGTHAITGSLRDKAGNVTKVGAEAVVDLKALTPKLEPAPDSHDEDTRFTITGPRAARGTLDVGTQKRKVTLDDKGHAEIALHLPDGSYLPKLALTDPFGRAATNEGPKTVVDTKPPKATVSYDKERARHQELVLTITGETGAAVHIEAPKALAGKFTLHDGRRTVRASVAPGDLYVTVSVTDAAGNTSQRTLTVHVADDWTMAQIVVALILLLLVLAVAVLIWLRRVRIAAWMRARRRARVAAAVERDIQRQAAQRAREEQRREQEALRAMQAYERELATWKAERNRLTARVDMARDMKAGRFTVAEWRWGKRRKGEEVLAVTATAKLVEVRQRQGHQYNERTDAGELVITNSRVFFVGSTKKRDWDYAKWLSHDHQAPGLTMILVSNRQKTSGVDYAGPDAERIRTAIEVGLSRHQGTWSALLDRLRGDVENHARLRPDRPEAPGGGVVLGKPVG